MPVIAETAYPRLPAEPEPAELEAFTPEPAEIAFARQKTRQPGPRLALLVLLKTFQRLGRVVRFADVPTGIIDHIAAAAGLASNTGELVGYGDTTYRVRLAALVRGYVGVTGYNREARGIAARACIEAARTRDDLADIVNAGLEELLRQRREVPAFGALLKLARAARALVNRSYHRRIAAALPPDARERLAALLVVPEGANRSGWDQVKADPPRPTTHARALFNRYAQWGSFGSSGLATAAERDEQRKMIKYNHLVANLLIFHTTVGMTRALDEIAADGHGAAITPEALAGTSPYLNEHLNRFGSYELDLSKPPAPLPFELPDQLRPPNPAAPPALTV